MSTIEELDSKLEKAMRNAQMCLSDLQGRVEAGKLQVFEDCIENMKAQAARIEELESKLDKAMRIIDAYIEDEGYMPSRVDYIYNDIMGFEQKEETNVSQSFK